MVLHALNDVWVRVECDEGIAQELSDYFTFETPQSQYMQRQARYRRWDGKIRLFKLKGRTIYRGLVPRIIAFAEQRGYEVENRVPTVDPLWKDPDELNAFIDALNLPDAPRDYQLAAVRALLDTERGIILSPTGSGKSLIIYLMTLLTGAKTLIVVPTIGLVSQMVKDFAHYGFDINQIHSIQGGTEKDADAKVYVSTWQSIYKMDSGYFEQFECIIVDEVHGAKAKSLSHLLEKAYRTPYRFGFTGTLDDTQANRLILEGLFGAVTATTTTRELQKQGHLAPIKVNLVFLQYPQQSRKNLQRVSYQEEIDALMDDKARMEFIVQLVKRTKGNTLVLFNFVEKQGIPLYDRLVKAIPGKTIHYVAGSVDSEDRAAIQTEVKMTDDNQVIVASYGTYSTGINIPNLRHLVFAHPSKSKIRVLQSIGRTLRIHESKDRATLWDVVDDLRIGKHVNFAMKHGQERALYYSSERFPIVYQQINLDALSRSRLSA